MAPTTLMTFLVRSPPSTRSVHLYGSWDNFRTAYPMQRDTRTGPEHWSGCHSFSNIICDGDTTVNGTPRQGGLKMGGTYWYYYKLDDDIEFHNSAEPSTTSCPMLPGQLVNVLNVPFALTSSSRSRNDSVSSTSSDYRTMNPTDKFLNPRPVPAKPSLPRLKTSPTVLQQSWSSSSSPASASSLPSRRGRSTSNTTPSHPSSANAYRVVRMKPSVEALSRSTSRGSNRSVGIIGAIRALTSPRTASPETTTDRGRSLPDDPASRGRSKGVSERSITPKRTLLGTATSIPEVDDNTISESAGELVLRRPTNKSEPFGNLPISSFAYHRRQRSLSREPSPLRSSLQSDTSPNLGTFDEPVVQYQPLATLKEVASAANTPVWPLTAVKVGGEKEADDIRVPFDLEKRLPTLPNTPSSAYPPSVVDEPSTNDEADDIANLRSHFSCTTIETESYTESFLPHDRSRFSDWTDGTNKFSPQSELSSSILDFEPISPLPEAALDFPSDDPITVEIQNPQDFSEANTSIATKQGRLPSAFSFSTVSSVASFTAPNSHVDVDSAKDAHFSWTGFQHYSLPSGDVGSGPMHKPATLTKHVAPLVVDENHRAGVYQSQMSSCDESTIPHSTSMQQLLAELSYLGGMIQQH
ncbi:uncharacterized protein Z520_09529 [Fonsecaea multimorphosa CBS 102226]|uniref:AMP-activated protein kinase glycogen-binding domain-containing protein n=1 Tax=Fonsecaea multimorphosa CBS 102226 TaxID=1442371 RepID=A0A0D2JWF1_9EURO|nr:uncharacterized protein Z520_09529 [Fonsecaea multimorphosa CBS 102226]KIX94839.1 hypothetical protein Z520_09529 [Fonsecaea multimorphosa CBS 102226]OAL20416.1 hypothetical protein AYO22_08910 [Fonsecaea multimorphosa]